MTNNWKGSVVEILDSRFMRVKAKGKSGMIVEAVPLVDGARTGTKGYLTLQESPVGSYYTFEIIK